MKNKILLFCYLFISLSASAEKDMNYFININDKKNSPGINIEKKNYCIIHQEDTYISLKKENQKNKNTNNKKEFVKNELNIVDIYLKSNNYSKSIEHCKKALIFCKQHNIQTSICEKKLADIYIQKEKYKEAIQKHIEILQTNISIDINKSEIYNKLSFCYSKINDFNNAYKYIIKSNKELPNDDINSAFGNKKLSSLYSNIKKDTTRALYYIKKAIFLFEKTKLYKQKLKCEIIQTSYLLNKKNTTKLEHSLDELIKKAKHFNLLQEEAEIELIKARLYSINNNPEKSYLAILKYKELIIDDYEDKLLNIHNKEENIENENKIESIKIEQLRIQKDLDYNIKTNNILVFVVLIIILMITICIFLFFKVSQNYKSILNIKNKLQKTKESKNKFFSIISHDLRSPFNSILGFSNLLKIEVKNDCNYNKIKEYTDLIKKSTKNVLFLMNNLVEWANSHQNNIKYNATNFIINDIIKTNFNLYRPLAKAKKIKLRHTQENLHNVFADKNMINTVIRNLINNAIKFTPENGEIKISYTEDTKYIIIEIQDNGCGISTKEQENIFNFNEKSKNKNKGIGLGLILSKDFMSINKGKLSIKSTKDKGSSFFVSIPKYQ